MQDFTYIHWHGKLVYLAATMNLSARFVVGWSFGLRHTADLICDSLEDAMFRFNSPDIVHNDRGSEYMSEKHYKICIERQIKMSASEPGEPWQNGFMESFFGTFKDEMRYKFNDAKTEAELYEMIANWIYYYNFKRIHTELKMSPASYAKKIGVKAKSLSSGLVFIDKVLQKIGS